MADMQDKLYIVSGKTYLTHINNEVHLYGLLHQLAFLAGRIKDEEDVFHVLDAAKRYGEIAASLGLAPTSDALIARIQEMNRQLDIPTCIRDYEGGIIDEKEFLEKLPQVAELAVGDACTGSNPRPITPAEMEKLLKCCFYDEQVDF